MAGFPSRFNLGWIGLSEGDVKTNAALPPEFSIELATGRIRPVGGQGTARSTFLLRKLASAANCDRFA
jgi:hypothetical protein